MARRQLNQDDLKAAEATRVIGGMTETSIEGSGFRLIVIETPLPTLLGRTIELSGDNVGIGRDLSNEVSVDEDSVSRKHAVLFHREGNWWLQDHGSTNGTQVNGRSLRCPQKLKSTDRIKIGKTVFKLVAEDDAEARYFERTFKMSATDPLTTVYNRRYFQQALDAEVSRAQRHERGLALIMLDIDHFKAVNDEHGHPAGDAVLRVVAHEMASLLREHDVIARYGGEEFAVILPETDKRGIVAVAERLRERVEKTPVEHHGKLIAVTVSAGCAVLRGGETSAVLIAHADSKLYEAKASGRNRVVI